MKTITNNNTIFVSQPRILGIFIRWANFFKIIKIFKLISQYTCVKLHRESVV